MERKADIIRIFLIPVLQTLTLAGLDRILELQRWGIRLRPTHQKTDPGVLKGLRLTVSFL